MQEIPDLESDEAFDEIGKKDEEKMAETENRRLEALKRFGLLEFSNRGELVVNVEALKDQKALANFFQSSKNLKHGLRNRQQLFEFLREKEGISKELYESDSYQSGEVKVRPIFYYPDTIKDAFSPEKIEKDNSMMAFWDISSRFNWANQVELPDGNKINLAEMYLAQQLYKKYQAKREPDGSLSIIDIKQGERKGFSFNLLKQSAGRELICNDGENTLRVFDNPIIFLQKYGKNLIKYNVLSFDDTEKMSGGKAAELFRVRRKVGKKGEVMVARVKLSLGKEFAGKEIVQLSDRIYGVVEAVFGHKEIVTTIQVPDDQTLEKKRQKIEAKLKKSGKPYNITDITARMTMNKSQIDIQPYSTTKRNPKFADESAEDYAERIRRIRTFNVLDKISSDLSREAGIGLHALSLEEQEWLISGAGELGKNYPEFIKFAKEYGLEGLRSFSSQQYSETSFEQLARIAKGFGQEAKYLFYHYTDILSRANDIAYKLAGSKKLEQVGLSQKNSDLFVAQVREAFVRKATECLAVAEELALNKNAQTRFYGGQKLESNDIYDVKRALGNYEQILKVIQSLLSAETKEVKAKLVERVKGEVDFFLLEFFDQQTGENSFLGIQMREKGVAFDQRNTRLEFDGEARINFLWSQEVISPFIDDESRQQALSVRLDREGLVRKGVEIVENDPTRKQGEISLDLGFAMAQQGTDNEVLGRVVSIGNALLAEKKQKNPQFYHNRESFSQELGEAETFAGIVRAIREAIEDKYLNQ